MEILLLVQLNNGYADCYYITEQGQVYNAAANSVLNTDKSHCVKLKRADGTYKKVSIKTLYRAAYGKAYAKDNIESLEGEEWKAIDSACNYFVSNKGRVKTYTGIEARLMKPYSMKSGYLRLDIIEDGVRSSRLLHRLVAVSYTHLDVYKRQVLKPSGTIFISGTLHNIYSIGMALEENNFKILNNITWQKTNPPPNLACKCFTHSTETILWAKKNIKKAKPVFNYAAMKEQNGGKQMKDVWQGALTPKKEKKHGKHPTQKPLYLLDRIIEAATMQGFIVLDPFVGSGTTCLLYTSRCV